MSLGQRLRFQRQKRKWTQKYVAEKLFVTNFAISRYEKDITKPDAETLKNLAELYEVSTDYLLGRTELTSDYVKILEAFKKYPVLYCDLLSDPEKKVKELAKMHKKLQKIKELFSDEKQ
ncbi:helix-turn-helix transcriptional regulator [Bacillus smithii]|uniref:helix-turn-helix domain-containing protein n=1 Tax=Bacillus smithii TaxID=1479 RepID=UPI002E20FA47|nr:helix-turn-helix transcriptional regulator [Bacillus smithii]MED4929025.1 helix-turn-helix transcriptional regulator [Bacillus smithii]